MRKKEKLTVITATTARPRQFALLEGYMARQTRQPDQWICAGEDHDGYSFNRGQEVLRRDRTDDPPGVHSLVLNYMAALAKVTGDKVIVMEDDDWFSDSYLQTMAEEAKADLWGCCPAFYWHVTSRKWRNMKNQNHASLTQTGFSRAVFPALEACSHMRTPYLDMTVWVHWPNTLGGSVHLFPNDDKKPLMVGMKGIPWGGTPGAGLGHDPVPGIYDPGLLKLRSWLGNDWLNYYSRDGQVLK